MGWQGDPVLVVIQLCSWLDCKVQPLNRFWMPLTCSSALSLLSLLSLSCHCDILILNAVANWLIVLRHSCSDYRTSFFLRLLIHIGKDISTIIDFGISTHCLHCFSPGFGWNPARGINSWFVVTTAVPTTHILRCSGQSWWPFSGWSSHDMTNEEKPWVFEGFHHSTLALASHWAKCLQTQESLLSLGQCFASNRKSLSQTTVGFEECIIFWTVYILLWRSKINQNKTLYI